MMRLLILLGSLLFLGCGDVSSLYPVTGRIIFRDRTPVKGAMVEFVSDDGSSARAKTDVNGRYELKTGNETGARTGKYRIAVIHMIVIDGAGKHSQAHHAKLVVHPRYAKPDSSGLVREVKPEANNFVIEVEPAALR